jgi:hypothetical protein
MVDTTITNSPADDNTGDTTTGTTDDNTVVTTTPIDTTTIPDVESAAIIDAIKSDQSSGDSDVVPSPNSS